MRFMTPSWTNAALADDPAVDVADLAATELAVALVLVLLNAIFLSPRLSSSDLDRVRPSADFSRGARSFSFVRLNGRHGRTGSGIRRGG
jgi:hypothetical protein